MAEFGDISSLLSVGGNSRRGMKILCTGPTGSGKSPLLASFPRPLAVIDCGEGGIQPYLLPPEIIDGKPKVSLERVFKSEEDLCFTVKDPDQMDKVIDWVLSNEDKFNSIVIDGYNLSWEDHMDYWNDRLGGDIQGGQWRLVKGPWKARQKRLMRSPLNVGMSCWLRDIVYEQTQARPGQKATLNIRQQEAPNIEKSVPYTVDIVFLMRVVADKMNRPTPEHEIVTLKARRPRTIDPKDLYVGKKVNWRSDKEEDLWALAVAPYVDRWKDAAITDMVDYLGMDAETAVKEMRDVNNAGDDAEAGRMVREMTLAYENGDLKDVDAFIAFWKARIAPTINLLSKEAQHIVIEMKEQIKNKIEGGND